MFVNFRRLGKTGIAVSDIGLGTWEISGDDWGSKDDEMSLRALRAGLDAGANFIDTAADYGAGHSEELVGAVLSEWPAGRDQVIVSTKIRPQCKQFAPPPDREIRDFFSPQWIADECEASLKRLRTPYIDLLFLHTWSRAWGHNTEWHSALTKLKQAGKIRAFGISIPDEGITDANVQVALGLVDAIQCVFNPFQQEPLYSLFPLAAAKEVGIVVRSPFSSGVMVQRWTREMTFPAGDWRGTWPLTIKPGWIDDQISMVEEIMPVITASGLSPAQASLSFVLASPEVSTVIPGSSNPDHVSENTSASGILMPEETLLSLRQLWINKRVHGTYNGSI